jgi:nucleoside-diphosphate-sugar epimerase
LDGAALDQTVLITGAAGNMGTLLARHLLERMPRLLWTEPTMLQLISAPDCVRAAEAAIIGTTVEGIYHVGDEAPVTIQDFLDGACLELIPELVHPTFASGRSIL